MTQTAPARPTRAAKTVKMNKAGWPLQFTTAYERDRRYVTALGDLDRITQKVEQDGTAAAKNRILNGVEYLRYLMNPTEMRDTTVRSSVDRSALKVAVDALETGRTGSPAAVLALVGAVRVALVRFSGE